MASVRIIYRMVTAGDMSGSLTSGVMSTLAIDNIGIEIISSGTGITGTLSFEASNDYDPIRGIAGNWFAVTANPAPAAPSGTGGVTTGVFNQYPYAWLRMKYTRSAGSGSLDAIAVGKEI